MCPNMLLKKQIDKTTMQHLSQKPPRHLQQLQTTLLLGGIAALLASASLHAQTVYRIVGPDGKVSFSDQAPIRADSKASNAQTGAAIVSTNPTLPYDVQQVVGKYPVTLYTSDNCGPCNAARNLLMKRGVPFTERTISTAEDSTALQQLSGGNSLPFATLGRQQLQGFSGAEWGDYLDAAGYPSASKLPSGYRNPPPTPMVASVKAVPKAETASGVATGDAPARNARASRPPAVDTTANPAGIKF